jgi:hypothetical protein
VEGRVLVWDGHDLLSHHRRFDYQHPALVKQMGIGANAMRYSYDFVPVDAEGRMAVGDDGAQRELSGFGLPVRAPGRRGGGGGPGQPARRRHSSIPPN